MTLTPTLEFFFLIGFPTSCSNFVAFLASNLSLTAAVCLETRILQFSQYDVQAATTYISMFISALIASEIHLRGKSYLADSIEHKIGDHEHEVTEFVPCGHSS